ncbi:DUF3892 domain-containing protein [Leuconostoc lactis]|uniref:DUF3892 domain-containing protein n=1 Tax=Leuconostoc lactis TaxID=1246 RepID=UPI0022E1088A|nr:DUF3892 domain-containing protein [Leuconostoc lactis]
MTDYYIYAVHYEQEHTHIKQVKTYKTTDGNNFTKKTIEFSRDDVVSAINNGTVFETLYKKSSSDTWERGKKVIADDDHYIKTERNNKKADNLDNLPEY